LIIFVNVVLFFQGKDFIVGLGMVGHVLATVVRSFLLLVAFFPLLLRACRIVVVMLLVVLVVAILLAVAVTVVVLIVVMGIVGMKSFGLQGLCHLASECPWS
jgi:hypothetical protein